MSFRGIADEMDAVNEQHLASRGLDSSHLGRAAARRWGGSRPVPKRDGAVAHVPTVVLRCGHEMPVESTEHFAVGNFMLCAECDAQQDIALIPKVREGDQHLPQQNDEPDVQSMVIADIEERRQLGISRYGTALQPFNGRNTLKDLNDELMDAVIYTRALLAMQEATFDKLVEVTADTLLKEQPELGVAASAIAEVIVYALQDALSR